MKKIFFIFISFAILTNTNAQVKKYILNGIITDKTTGERVKNATVQINGFDFGTISNVNGYFRAVIDEKPTILYISHLSYEKKVIRNLDNYKNLKITLEQKTHAIEEVVVTGDIVKNIHVPRELWAFDYEFYEDKIILLGFKKTLSDIRLILMRNWGDTICSIPFTKKVVRLKKDPLDGIYLETKDSTYQIFYFNGNLELLPPVPNKKFNDAFSTCVGYSNGNLYFQYNRYHNFVSEIYWVNLINKKKQYDFRTIRDTIKINRFEREYDFFFYAKKNLELGMSVSEIEKNLSLLRESQQFTWVDTASIYSSLYVPFVKVGNKFCILNYFESKLEVYSDKNELLNEFPINFHKNPSWEKDFFVDPVKKKLYNLFRKNGISSLREISLVDGTLGPAVKIPEFTFVEKIKVRDGSIYFLYRDNINEGPRMLYKMSVD